MSVLEITTYGRDTLRRLRRELRIIDPELMPNLALAFELDPSAPTATLVTEDLPDITLDDLISIAPLPAAAVLHALRDIAGILQAMHACGLVHGHLRPSSVYVMPDGRAALAHPGAAPPGTGTSHDTAERADAYGFAVLAIELLTGVHPVDPRHAISMATALPLLPNAAATELKRALTTDPSRRPLPVDLVATLTAIPAEEWPTSHLLRTPPPVEEPTIATSPDPVDAEPSDNERWAPETPETPEDAETAEAPEDAETAEAPEPEPPLVTAVAPQPEPVVVVQIVPPRRKRSLFRRILGPFVILLGLMTVFAGGAVGATMLFAPTISAGDATAAPLQVRRVSLSATPPQAFCPRASLHFAATVVTDGRAGVVEVRWRLPDGITADSERFSLHAGQTTLRAAIDVTLTGNEKLRGKVVAIVSPAGVRASVPIRYLCPDATKTRRNQSRSI
jgi:hypothetical protein